MQVDNSYLPPRRKDDVTLMSVTSGCHNDARTLTPQNVFSHTNPITHVVYDEPLPSTKGLEGTMHLPFVVADLPGIGSFTCPLLVEKKPDLWKKSQASNSQV